MNAPSWTSGPPRKILVATDLSARSDRALDRAVSLAQQWQAQLLVLHVLEEPPAWKRDLPQLPSWKRPADPLSVARRNVLEELREISDKATILIEKGDPAETITAVADEQGCDLIVIGVARHEPFGQFSLGRTVDRLVRRSRVPLLVVKNRVRHPYHDIVVATDFSEPSRHALDAAARFFPDKPLTAFHAYDPPMSGLVSDPPSYRDDYRKMTEQECEEFLQAWEKSSGGRRPNVLLEYGQPNHLLHDYVSENRVDLVAVGTHGRSLLFDVFIGSIAKQILHDVPCDILVIREPQAKAET